MATIPKTMKLLLAGGALALLAGCLSSGGPQTRRADFVCDGGERVTVVFQPNMARIVSVDPHIEMPRIRTASGFHFGTAQNSIRGQGSRMTWTRGFAQPVSCRELRR